MSIEIGNSDVVVAMMKRSLETKKESFFQRRDFGSDLHQLIREKDDEFTRTSIPGRVRVALQWMLSAEIISNLETSVTRVRSGLLCIECSAQYNGRPISLTQFFPVGVPE